MNVKKSESGFTLVEVLAALVVSALLVGIILDGSVAAKMRTTNQEMQMDALLVARSHLDDLREERGNPAETAGEIENLVWNLREQEIARDPRGAHILVEAQISVGSDANPRLIELKKRYLKQLLIQ